MVYADPPTVRVARAEKLSVMGASPGGECGKGYCVRGRGDGNGGAVYTVGKG